MIEPPIGTGSRTSAYHREAGVATSARSRDARVSQSGQPRRGHGFSLVELVVILLLVGILSVAAVARMDSISTFGERTEYDTVRAALQYARKAAIAKRRYVCVQTTASALTLTVDTNPPESTSPAFSGACPFGAALPLPQPDASCATPNVVCLRHTSLTATSGTFQFDALGRSTASVHLTVSGYAPITVEAETGLVY
jgi:MSHA pilin protein MshC